LELADGIDRAGAWLGFPGELNFEAEDLAVVEGCGPDFSGAVLGRIGTEVTVIDPPRLRDLVGCLREIEDGRFGVRTIAAGGARLGESEFAGAPGGLVRCSVVASEIHEPTRLESESAESDEREEMASVCGQAGSDVLDMKQAARLIGVGLFKFKWASGLTRGPLRQPFAQVSASPAVSALPPPPSSSLDWDTKNRLPNEWEPVAI